MTPARTDNDPVAHATSKIWPLGAGKGLHGALRLLNPGDLVCDLLGATEPDDRTVLRMFVNLGVYAKIAILIALVLVR